MDPFGIAEAVAKGVRHDADGVWANWPTARKHTVALKSDVTGIQTHTLDVHTPLHALQAYLKASNTEEGDRFGYSVAVSGDWVVVGPAKQSASGVAHSFVMLQEGTQGQPPAQAEHSRVRRTNEGPKQGRKQRAAEYSQAFRFQ